MIEGRTITVLQFSNVSFNYSNDGGDGIFALVSERNDLRFEWTPAKKFSYFENKFEDKSAKVIFRLCEVVEIERIEQTLKSISLKFKILPNLELPFFIFHNSPHASISHMLEFLVFKKLFKETDSNVFHTLIKYSKPPFPIKNAVTARDVIIYSQHLKIMQQLETDVIKNEKTPITAKECKTFFDANGKLKKERSALWHHIRANGTTKEAKYILWPYLTGLFKFDFTKEEKENVIKEKLKEYSNIFIQFTSLIDMQKNEVNDISSTLRTLNNDVKRTDRSLPEFKEENSPYSIALRNILAVYSFYNKDTDYVQGLGDILSPIMLMCINKWDAETDECEMVDGTKYKRIEAEGYIFAIYSSFMEKIQQDRMFQNLLKRQEESLEKVFMILSHFHEPFATWCQKNELESLNIIYKQFLLLFKREFSMDDILTIWEYFLTIKTPFVFPRFFAAAILLQLFPKLLFESKGAFGEAMLIVDTSAPKLSAEKTLDIANRMRKLLRFKIPYAISEFSENVKYIEYRPKFLSISE